MNATTGLVSGSISSMGSWHVNISVTDGVRAHLAELHPSPRSTPRRVASTPVAAATSGVSYYYDVNATNGDALLYDPYDVELWMSFNVTTGVISGVPVLVGSFSIAISTWDGQEYSWQNFTLVVYAAGGGGGAGPVAAVLAADFVYNVAVDGCTVYS